MACINDACLRVSVRSLLDFLVQSFLRTQQVSTAANLNLPGLEVPQEGLHAAVARDDHSLLYWHVLTTGLGDETPNAANALRNFRRDPRAARAVSSGWFPPKYRITKAIWVTLIFSRRCLFRGTGHFGAAIEAG